MRSGILFIRDVRAARRGFGINFQSLRKFVTICRGWSDGGVFAVASAYEGLSFGFELSPLLRGAGGTACVEWV